MMIFPTCLVRSKTKQRDFAFYMAICSFEMIVLHCFTLFYIVLHCFTRSFDSALSLPGRPWQAGTPYYVAPQVLEGCYVLNSADMLREVSPQENSVVGCN